MTVSDTDKTSSFEENAQDYDKWFLANKNVLQSELLLLRHVIGEHPGRTLSVGCGSGLFEHLLARNFSIYVSDGLEVSPQMAQIARSRGMTVTTGSADSMPYLPATFQTVLFNGSSSYMEDIETTYRQAWKILKPGGRMIVLDVTAESGYGTLYALAARNGKWNGLERISPPNPYPVEFLGMAKWKTVPEKVSALKAAGFAGLTFWQTLTTHPAYSDNAVEYPSQGYERGDYIAICAVKQ